MFTIAYINGHKTQDNSLAFYIEEDDGTYEKISHEQAEKFIINNCHLAFEDDTCLSLRPVVERKVSLSYALQISAVARYFRSNTPTYLSIGKTKDGHDFLIMTVPWVWPEDRAD